MEDLTKATTKQWYECGSCKTKMASISIGGSSTNMFDIFGTQSTGKAMYCENKECEKFGYLTVVGIKKEE